MYENSNALIHSMWHDERYSVRASRKMKVQEKKNEIKMTVEVEEKEEEEEDFVLYKKIDGTERYRWIKYLNLRVIEDTETEYINISKMCSMYGSSENDEPKTFSDWYDQEETIALIECVKKNMPLCGTELVQETRNGPETVRGTYIHRDLVPSAAMWYSVEFGFKVSQIMNAYIMDMYKKKNQHV